MAERTTLYSPDGRAVSSSAPAEVSRLRAAGYTDTRPFVPDEHTVPEVREHIEEHPEEAPTVAAAERRGKGRKSITDA
jgi:hypothetical protein